MSVVDRTYARALYDSAKERGRVTAVQEELGELVTAMRDVSQLRSVLLNPQLDPRSKAAVLDAVMGESDELTRNFLRLVTEKGRIGHVEGIHRELERISAAAEGQLKVELTTAYELSADEAKAIVKQIEQVSGRPVEAVTAVDPDLIGGIVLQAGSFRADASVRGRLNRMRQELLTRS